MALDGVRYPVASVDNELVWADLLAVAGDRPTNAMCLGCNEPVVLRAGSIKRPHFAHRSVSGCTSGDRLLHDTAVRVIAERIEAVIASGATYPVTISCVQCRWQRQGNLARHRGGSVHVDRVLEDAIRPDILVRSADGKPRVVVEVVVTHPPEPATLDLYSRLRIPAVIVHPTWDNLGELREGFTDAICRSGGFQIIGYPCTLLRHPLEEVPRCPQCTARARWMTAERATLKCYKCRGQVLVLDLVCSRGVGMATVSASCPDLHNVENVATRLGIVLRWEHSATAGGSYLMHMCPSCGAKQGDNFLYSGGGATDLSKPAVRFIVCADGHWTEQQSGDWPDAIAIARIGRGIGLVGEPAGLFVDRPPTVRVKAGHGALTEFLGHVRGGW